MNLSARALGCALLLTLSFSPALAQSRVTLLDATTDEPVAGATLHFSALEGSDAGKVLVRRSDARGVVSNPFTARAIIVVSHVGYQVVHDTIQAIGEHFIHLRPKSIAAATVVVTGQAEPTSSDRSLAAVRVINRAQIDARSAVTLRDLMSSEIGVGLSNDMVLGTSLSLQGLSGQNVKVLVDGVPVIGRIGGAIDMAQVPLANAERVEIVEGPMSVLYGTDALGGVVNIITSKKTRGALSASAHAYYESVGSYTGDARVGAFIGDTRIWLAGGRTLFTGYANPDTSRAKRWKPREQTTVDADITQFIGRHTIGLSASFLDDYILNRGLPRLPYRETAFDDTYRTRRASGRLLAEGVLDENPYEFSAAYSSYSRYKNTFLKNLVSLETLPSAAVGENDTSLVDTWNVRARINGRLAFAPMTWETGGEATLEEIAGGRIENSMQDQGDYALYARLEYTPWPSLSLQPGVRFTYNTRYSAPAIPSLHVKVVPDSALVLRASYGRGFRAPSLRDLYFTFVDINHNIRGNTSLRAETSHNINAGATFTRRSESLLFEAGFNGYFNNVHDLITLVADTGDMYVYSNVGDVRTIGGLLSSSVRWERGTAKLGLALVGSSSDLGDRDEVPAYTVAPEIGAEASWRFLDDFELATDYKYIARVPRYMLGANDRIERRTSDDYHMLNASVAYHFLSDLVKLRAGVRNIADVTDVALGVSSGAVHGSGSSSVPVAWGRTFIFDLQLRVP